MSDINTITIIGRLTKDPEIKYTTTNKALAKFSIAVNGRKKDDPNNVSFFNITVWEKLAENCGKYLFKGSQVCIGGFLKQNRYQDKEGNSKSSVDIIANSVQFIGNKKDNGSSESKSSSEKNDVYSDDPFDDINYTDSDDEIPF